MTPVCAAGPRAQGAVLTILLVQECPSFSLFAVFDRHAVIPGVADAWLVLRCRILYGVIRNPMTGSLILFSHIFLTFCADANFLSQSKNLTAFSASSKTFVQKAIHPVKSG